MKKCFLHAESRKNKTMSKCKTLDYKSTPKLENKSITRTINAARINSEEIHAKRVEFNLNHFGCKTFYHQNGSKTWKKPITAKEKPMMNVKRIIQIIVPSNFYFVTNKTRNKKIYERDVHHRVVDVYDGKVNITAHAENAAKEMLINAGINKEFIMTNRNVCYVTLHKQVSEEKIRSIFPTLNISVYKIMR